MNTPTDTPDVAHFNALAEEWWDTEGPMRTLHDITAARVAYIAEQNGGQQNPPSPPFSKGGIIQHILDVGCGGGLVAEALTKQGAEVTGIDLAESLIHVARQHAHAENLTIHYVCKAVEVLAEERPAQFDIVTCLDMLEHVDHPETILKACAQLVKPGGLVIISTLNRHPKAFMLGILAAEYVFRLVPRGTHTYTRFIKPSELVAAVPDTLTLRDLTGLTYHPFTRSTAFSRDVRINYLATFVAAVA